MSKNLFLPSACPNLLQTCHKLRKKAAFRHSLTILKKTAIHFLTKILYKTCHTPIETKQFSQKYTMLLIFEKKVVFYCCVFRQTDLRVFSS